jgi:hypothetical protein
MLTPSQLESLNKLIDNKINLFVAKNISSESFTAEEIKALRQSGVQVESIRPQDRLIYQSFALGTISGAIPKSVLNATNYDNFVKYLGSKDFIPLNVYERAVIRSLERQSLSDIRGIGSRYKKTLEGALNTSERKYYEDTIRNKVLEGKAKKDSLRNISNEIAKELDSYGRDFDRIVQSMSHQAFSEGRQAFIEKNYGDDAEIWFSVYDGACKICISSYLTNGLKSEPKSFKVGSLPSPQTNYGVKIANQVTTMSPRHPYCRCTPHPKPKGYEWSEDTQSFVPPKDYKPKVERKSKVKVKFNNREYEV